jgi:hypothetical protein
MYRKTIQYIDMLKVPKGYTVEKLCIRNSKYITKSYNEAMLKTDAKYKVYMHQDVFILNKSFIKDTIDIFKINEKIGLIGVVGAKNLPSSGIWWESKNRYGKVYDSHTGRKELLQFNKVKNCYENVKVIDGLIMITQHDIPWRDDIFKGWHFYDASQSIEFIKSGYEVVVPYQKQTWCMHECGITPLERDFYTDKNIFLRQYKNYIF